MATTTILDIVKISELQVVNRLTDKDYLIVNDVRKGDVESKTIVINDLVVSIGERLSLRQLKDVSNKNPKVDQILRWSGSQWEPSNEDTSNSIQLSDISVNNLPTPFRGGKLEYDERQGILSFSPADVYGPLSNHSNVSGQTPSNGDVLTWSAASNNWYPADSIDLVVVQRPPSEGGSLEIEGNKLIYTPPYLGDYLTEVEKETDPVFMASPAATITNRQINNWDTAHSWGDHAQAGYLKSARLNDLLDVNVTNAADRTLLKYNATTRSWYPGTSVVERLGDIEDVVTGGARTGDVIKWNNTSKVWFSDPNRLNGLSDVNTSQLTDGSILVWDGSEWITPKKFYITQVIAGGGLDGGGTADTANNGVIRLDVRPGRAIDLANDSVNVKPGKGIDTSDDSVNVRPGKGIDTSDDSVNVRAGLGCHIDRGTNSLEVGAGSGLFHNSSGTGLNVGSGAAIDVSADTVGVRIADNQPGLKINAANRIENTDTLDNVCDRGNVTDRDIIIYNQQKLGCVGISAQGNIHLHEGRANGSTLITFGNAFPNSIPEIGTKPLIDWMIGQGSAFGRTFNIWHDTSKDGVTLPTRKLFSINYESVGSGITPDSRARTIVCGESAEPMNLVVTADLHVFGNSRSTSITFGVDQNGDGGEDLQTVVTTLRNKISTLQSDNQGLREKLNELLQRVSQLEAN